MTGKQQETLQPAKDRPHLWIVEHYAAIPHKDGRSGRHIGLAAELVKRGWAVTLFIASTSHPDGRQHMRGARLRERTTLEGVDVIMLRSNAYGSSARKRLLGMVLFSFHVLLPMAGRAVTPPDIVIGSTVHPFAAWAGSQLAKRHQAPFVFEVRDVWPDYLTDLGKLRAASPLARLFEYVMKRSAISADLVISPLSNIAGWLSDIGLPRTPSVWISNGIPHQALAYEDAVAPPSGGTFKLGYFGSHGPANSLSDLLTAFDQASREAPTTLELHLYGNGPSKVQLIEHANRLESRDNIFFNHPIPRSEVVAKAQSYNALVLSMQDHSVYRYGISPNKLFDYMLAGRPVLLQHEGPNPVMQAKAGVCVKPGSVDELKDGILSLSGLDPLSLHNMGSRGKAHVLSQFSYPHLASLLDGSLRQLLQ